MRKFTHIPEQRWGGGWVGSLPIIRAFDGNRRFFFFLSTFFFLFFFSFSFTICSSNQSCRFPFSVKSMTLVESQFSHHKPSFASHVLPGPRSPPLQLFGTPTLKRPRPPLRPARTTPGPCFSTLLSLYESRLLAKRKKPPRKPGFFFVHYVGTIHIVTKSLSYTYVKEYTIYT